MPDIYLIIVVLLFLLAISDLIVGVSNDAVNFLNSAIGAKVASRQAIMIVASLGILLGATFSGGMMEVARKGIFNPQFYYFSDIMALFLAVMLTDIILLDLFNTFGLPTSTTVSIVFELLGAAVVIAVIKTLGSGAGISSVGSYINTSSALAIITGIFLSVAAAFVIGALLMYLSRLLFTFHYRRRLNWAGALWAGLAMMAMTYFLLFKGMKGATFIPVSATEWIQENLLQLLVGSFLGWSLIMQILTRLFKVNILRFIVLFGTFSLAMAFAGNDLVNFIGVPVAGFESFHAWRNSGQAAESFKMTALSQAYPTKTYLLIAAGVIMTITLWLSRKARSVTDTEVNLGRQHEGLERFSPNWLSRLIVRGARGLGARAQAMLPDSWLEKAESSFDTKDPVFESKSHHERPAFDLVRAAVNLTVASALIALATSYKLPLSTTYVSFMVAMGTSLSDRAWGRDSAVYRVAGVLNVIGGWFATAFIAFTVSGTFALLIHQFGLPAIAGLVLLAVIFIYRTFSLHRIREKEKEKREAAQATSQKLAASEIIRETATKVAGTLEVIRRAYSDTLTALRREDLYLIRKAQKEVRLIKKQNQEFKYTFYADLRRIEDKESQGSRVYLLAYDLEQDIIQSIDFIANACREHIENSHLPLLDKQDKNLSEVQTALSDYLDQIMASLQNLNLENQALLLNQKQQLHTDIERLLAEQVKVVKNNGISVRNSLLYFSLLLETKDLIAVAARFVKLYQRLKNYSPERPFNLVSGN